MLSDAVTSKQHVLKTYFETNFIILMLSEPMHCYTTLDILLFELEPKNKNITFYELFKIVNLIFLASQLGDISTMGITIYYQAYFYDNEHGESGIDLQIFKFLVPSMIETTKNLVQYCDNYVNNLSIYSYSIKKIQVFECQNSINSELFSQLQI